MSSVKPVTAATCVIFVALFAVPTAQPPARPVSIEDLLSIKQVGTPKISPDGRAILYTVRGWETGTGRDSQRKDARSHVWRVMADGGTPPRQMTYGDRGESAPEWSPDGKVMSFLSARAGDGEARGESDGGPAAQIWLMSSGAGEPWKLTSSKEAVTSYAWSPDGSKIAYVSRDPLAKDVDDQRKRRDDETVYEGDFRLSHVWVIDVPAPASPSATIHDAKEIVHDDRLTVRGEPSWSADSHRIAFAALPTTMARDDRADVYIVAAAGGTPEKITPNPGSDANPVWSPDGSTIAFTSGPTTDKPLPDGTMPAHIGNDHLMLYDVKMHTTRDASSAAFDLSPGPVRWSADSKWLLFSSGVRTARDVFTYELATRKYARLTQDRVASVGSISKDRIALVMESSSEPPEIYLAEHTFNAPRKLTDTNPHTRAFALGKTETISWKSDGLTIEGVLLKPVNYQEGKRYPLLVVAHGGPSGAFVDNYRVGYGDGSQNWAGEGWAVLYPNPRGSTNYGEKFEQANMQDWGGGDYRDIMTGVDAVIAKGIADPEKLAFQGWSYGGYMTCWVVSQTTRFKAAMMGAGLTSLVSMYGTNDIPNVMIPYFGGTPSKETNPLYMERSGITYADRVTTPLLILHGASDARVPIGQPMEFYRALKDRGKTVELVFYPREGHGFQEYYHQLDRMQRQHDWIARYTLGAGAKKSTEQ